MAKKPIIWSVKAQQNRFEILDYWIKRNKSKSYATQLFQLFKLATDLITEHPEIGKPTSQPGVRIKIVRDYLMFYEIQPHRIEILFIWDSRQNPENLPGF